MIQNYCKDILKIERIEEKLKKYKKTLTVIIILVVAVIMFAAFFGINIKNGNGEKVNLIPDFKLGMEFGNSRVITATVNEETTKTIYDAEGNVVEPEDGVEYTEEEGYSTVETKINDDSIKTLENYKKSKDVIEKRLKGNDVSEYFIDMNETTGEIKIEIPEDANADEIQSMIQNTGSLLLLDGETFEVVFDSSYLKTAEVMYSQGDLETAVFLQLTFNDEGTQKLQELNNIYVETTTQETNEEGKVEDVTKSKTVWVILNDAFIGSTVLPNIVYDNKIMLTFGISNDPNEIQKAVEEAQKEAILLNSGTAPIVYDYSNEVKETSIDNTTRLMYLVGIGIVFVIMYIYLVIKFKAKGFIAVYFQIGYLATLLLILRLTNVILTIEGMAGIVIGMVLEYIFTYIVLNTMAKDEEGMYKKANLTFFLNTLPIYVISVIFTFAARANINSFGMTLFWGIIIIYIYNFIFPKFIFENLKGRSQ